MTLLEPLNAIIAASLALPILFLLYMLKLRRRPVRVSSSMFWTAAAKDLEANVPLKWLKPSWLLFLQILAVLLLALALGRPAVVSQQPDVDRLVLIVDRSASTRADWEESNVFDQIRSAARARIESLDRSGFVGEASLVVLDAAPWLAAGPTRDLRELATALNELRPTDQSQDLEAALRLAGTIAAGPDQARQTETPESSSAIELFTDNSLELPAGSAVRAQRAGFVQPSANAGITALAARRDIEDPSLLRVLVTVAADRPDSVTLPIEFSIDGRPLATRPVRLQPDAAEPSVIRGSITEPLRLPFGGLVSVRIDRDDVLAADNAAGVRIAPPPSPAVVLVQPTREDLESEASWVMIETLKALGPSSLVQLTADEFAARGVPEATDLLILDGVEPFGSVVTTPTLSFGVDPRFASLAVEQAPVATDRFIAWERKHPIWRGASIDSILWRTATRFVRTDSVDDPLATGRLGPVAVLDQQRGIRRLALSFRPADSTWTTHHSFALFLINAVEFLTWSADAQAGLVLTTSSPALLTPAFVGDASPDSLTSPTGGSRAIAPAGDGTWALGLLETAGEYTLGPSGTRLEVSVLDERETLLGGREGDQANAQPGARPRDGRVLEPGERRGTREVWYWLVIPAVLLLAIEWIIYARRARI